MSEEICVARQPILSRDKELFGYELLFRNSLASTENKPGSIISDVNATAGVLDNVLNNIGIDKLVNNSFAFINCSYDFLLSEIPLSLNKDIFVIEILETVQIDDKIIEMVKRLHGSGFKIAIDDFIPTKEKLVEIKPIVPYLNYCKLEFPEIKDLNLLRSTIKSFQKKNILVLAEKIETEDDFKICYDAGADLYQGYFFTRPENIKSVKISTDSLGVLRVLALMNKPELDMVELENEFKHLPDLTITLLKYLNSAAFAMRSTITSIRHALNLLGTSNLKKWLLIVAYAGSYSKAEKSPLLMNATMRANFFGEMAKKLNWSLEQTEKVYLMGLISHLDALYQTSLDNVLKQISLDDEISSALLEKAGVMGTFINLINLIESDDFKNMDKFLTDLDLSSDEVSECLYLAYKNSMV